MGPSLLFGISASTTPTATSVLGLVAIVQGLGLAGHARRREQHPAEDERPLLADLPACAWPPVAGVAIVVAFGVVADCGYTVGGMR
ncbi:MAG: hypothetical protein U0S48_06215 [Solirubrobacteraceae bacterium]